MSVVLNVFLTASARTPRMESLKLFCVSGLASSLITTSVYSDTCGRRDPMIMFTIIALPPPGMPDALALADVICVLMLFSRAYRDRSTMGRRLLLCPLRSSLSTSALSIGPMKTRHWSALRIP